MVFNYVNLLLNQNRKQEAVPVLESAIKAAPENKQFSQLLEQVKSVLNK